jgi:hypothetical protein
MVNLRPAAVFVHQVGQRRIGFVLLLYLGVLLGREKGRIRLVYCMYSWYRLSVRSFQILRESRHQRISHKREAGSHHLITVPTSAIRESHSFLSLALTTMSAKEQLAIHFDKSATAVRAYADQ